MAKIYTVAVWIILISSCTSCRMYINNKYKFNRKFEYKSRQEYLKAISSENGFPESTMFYVDSSSYPTFIPLLTGSVYFGSFINDSLAVKKTAFFMENESCMGRIGKEIERIIALDRFDSLDNTVRLSDYNFYLIKDNKKKTISESPKKIKLILIYTYQFGTYYKALYNEILSVYEKNKNDCELYILSVDPLYYLKD